MTNFDPQAARFEYWARRRGPHHYDALIAFMPKGGGQMLDAGCGAGRLVIQMAARAEFVIGVDLSATMLGLAQMRQAETNLCNLAWVQGNLEGLPFQSSTFDYVVSTSVLKFTDLNRVLPELKRVIKPGGRLALKDEMPYSSRWGFRPFYLLTTMRMASEVYATHGLQPAWQITVARLRGLPEREKTWYASLTPAVFRERCSHFFPGCQFQQEQEMLMLWESS